MSTKLNNLPLFNHIAKEPFPINGNPNAITLLNSIIYQLLERGLGSPNNIGEWDPYIAITFNDGLVLNSQLGLPDMVLDNNNSTVAFYIADGTDGEPPLITYDLSTIATIQLMLHQY